MSKRRQLDRRRGMIGGGVFAVFFTVLTVVTSTPESRITAGVLAAGTFTVMAVLFFRTVNAWNRSSAGK
jgi:hypothetical protein